MKTKIVLGILLFISLTLNFGFVSRETARTPYLVQAAIYENTGACNTALFKVSKAYNGDWKNWENSQHLSALNDIQSYFYALYAGGKIYEYDPMRQNGQLAMQIVDTCISKFEKDIEMGYVIPDVGLVANFVLPAVQMFYGDEGFPFIRKEAKSFSISYGTSMNIR